MSECKCSIDAADDCDAPEFYRKRDRTARKAHECGECGRTIEPGEVYRYTTAKWEGYITTFKECRDCQSLRHTFFCSSLFGSLWDDFQAEARENNGRFSQACIDLLTPRAKQKALDIIKEIRRKHHEVMEA